MNDVPYIMLDFPLVVGKEWSNDLFIMTRESRVVGRDYIELPESWSYCDVIYSEAINSNQNLIYSEYEWYNDNGLMKFEREFAVHDILNEYGVLIDSVISYEFWELINMEIQQ
jgi:hypothetical protein